MLITLIQIVALLPFVLRLAFEGKLTAQSAGLLLVLFVFFIAVRKSVVGWLVPLTAITLFIIEYTDGTATQIGGVALVLLPLVVALLGFYIIFNKVFGGFKP